MTYHYVGRVKYIHYLLVDHDDWNIVPPCDISHIFSAMCNLGFAKNIHDTVVLFTVKNRYIVTGLVIRHASSSKYPLHTNGHYTTELFNLIDGYTTHSTRVFTCYAGVVIGYTVDNTDMFDIMNSLLYNYQYDMYYTHIHGIYNVGLMVMDAPYYICDNGRNHVNSIMQYVFGGHNARIW